MKASSLSPTAAAMIRARQQIAGQIRRLHGLEDCHFSSGYVRVLHTMELCFRDEELAMERLRLQSLQAHRAEHARALQIMHQIELEVEDGAIARGRLALGLLDRWFSLHRATMDLMLAFDLHRNETTANPVWPERRQPAEWPRFHPLLREPAPLLDWSAVDT